MFESNKTTWTPSEKLKRSGETIATRVEDTACETPEIGSANSQVQSISIWIHAKRFWPFILIALGAILFLSSGVWKQLHIDKLSEHYHLFEYWSVMHPTTARLLLIAAIVLLVVLGMPGSVALVIVGGMFFGTLQGALYSTLADGISGSLLFVAARRAMNGNGPSTNMVSRLRLGFAGNPISYSLFLRLVPIFPYAAVSVALAWLGSSYRMFVLTSMLGVFPVLLVYSALGAGLSDSLAQQISFNASLLKQPEFLAPLIVLAILALLPILLRLRRTPRAQV